MTLVVENMPRYERYKDSGFEWLGDIPEGWEVKKVKFLFQLGRGRVISQQELDDDGVYPVYSSQTKNDGILGYISSYDFDCDQITWTTDGANAGTVFLRKGKHNCTNVCGTLKPISYNKLNMFYISHSLSVSTKFYKRPDTNGAKIMNGEMANVFIAFPPTQEQHSIATFLDQKTTQIDQAINIKEQQIALLKERKQIIIQNAVTKGLDPNVPMKDSGVDWIGEIPKHWKVVKLKLLTNKIVDGSHFTPTYVDMGAPFLRVTDLTNIRNGKLDWSNVRFIPKKEHLALIKRAKAEKGDILLSKNGTIGLTKVVDWDEEFSFFVSLCLIKPRPTLNPYYFESFFNSPIVDRQITHGSSRTSVTNLHLEKIKELLVVLPTSGDQQAIIDYLNKISDEYDFAVNLQMQQINKLKEYKASLINSAVTGKIKVT